MAVEMAVQRKGDQSARLKMRAPEQTRAQETLERIVVATQRLLCTHRFEDITIAQIVAEADTSTGSFYARFASKDALLPYLYEVYNASSAVATDALSAGKGLKARSLREAVAQLIGVLRTNSLKSAHLMRTMVLYSRSHPERIPESAQARSKRFLDMMATLFAPHVKGDRSAERARFAAFAATTLIREYRLFPNAPLAKALGVTEEQFVTEVRKMMTAYLEAAQ